MRNIGNLILTVGVLLIVVSGILVFINSVNRNIIGVLLVLGLILSGAGSNIKKKIFIKKLIT